MSISKAQGGGDADLIKTEDRKENLPKGGRIQKDLQIRGEKTFGKQFRNDVGKFKEKQDH